MQLERCRISFLTAIIFIYSWIKELTWVEWGERTVGFGQQDGIWSEQISQRRSYPDSQEDSDDLTK